MPKKRIEYVKANSRNTTEVQTQIAERIRVEELVSNEVQKALASKERKYKNAYNLNNSDRFTESNKILTEQGEDCRNFVNMVGTYYPYPPTTQSSEVDVEVDGLKINFRVSSLNNFGKSSSELSSTTNAGLIWEKKGINMKDFTKLRHETVMMSLTGEFFGSDFLLRSIAEIGDDWDKTTPDEIFYDDSKVYLLELKTNAGGMKSMQNFYDSAVSKYRDAFIQRVALSSPLKTPVIWVVVAGKRGVISNIALEEGLMLAIKSHFYLAESIVAAAAEKNFIIETDDVGKENRILMRKVIKEAVRELPSKDSSSAPLITKEMVDTWKNAKLDKAFLAKRFKDLFNASITEFGEKVKPVNHSKLIFDFYKRLFFQGEEPPRACNNIKELEKCYNEGNKMLRTKKKALCPLPLCVPTTAPSMNSSVLNSRPFIVGDNWLEKMWDDSFEFAMKNQDRFQEETLQEKVLRAYNAVSETDKFEQTSTNRNKWHRVNLSLNNVQRVEMACSGIKGKRIKDDPEVEAHKEENKQPFSPFVDTSDISSFIKGYDSWLEKSEDWNLVDQTCPEILQLGKVYMKKRSLRNLGETFLKEFLKTKLGGAASLYSCIIEEINISMNQNCKGDELVLKKLPNYNVWMLLSPTNNERPCGVYLMYEDVNELENPFGNFSTFTKSHYKFTNGCTIDKHKVSQYLYLQFKLAAMFGYWAHEHSLDPLELLQRTQSKALLTNNEKDCLEHFMFTTTVILEDKEQTSTNLQLVRFSYMEMTKESLFEPNPLKILDKAAANPKSRLLTWSYNRIIKSFLTMIEMEKGIVREESGVKVGLKDKRIIRIKRLSEMRKKIDEMVLEREEEGINEDEIVIDTQEDSYTDETEERAKDEFPQLISWVSGRRILSYKLALALSYLGAMHNKDEGESFHGYLKIFSKIIKEELEMRNAELEYMGYSEKENLRAYKDHEYDYKWALYCGRVAKKSLDKKFSGKFSQVLQENFFHNFKKKTGDTLATLKASTIVPDNFNFQEESGKTKKKKTKRRRKVLQGILELIENSLIEVNCFENLGKLIDQLEEIGGVIIDLFKKLQIGGTREISILDIRSRIVIHFVETLVRTINEMLDSEMLTKGDQKILKSDEHYSKVYTLKKNSLNFELTCIDSDDAQTWCQRLMLSEFGAVLFKMIPEEMFMVCSRVLNLMTNKKMMLPDILLKRFLKETEIFNFDEAVNELKRQFLGTSEYDDLMEKLTIYFHNRSNMGQGVFHYTSSLLHVAHLMAVRKLLKMFLAHLKEKKMVPEDMVLVCTIKVSSDDSSMLNTLLSKSSPTLIWKVLLCIFSIAKGCSYQWLSIKRSEPKSTYGSFSKVEEFNSIWTVNNSLMIPTIKFVFASINSRVTAKFDDRQLIFSNLRQQVVENGGSTLLASIIQECQARVHYITMGANFSELGRVYLELLLDKPHPAFGFFMFEPEEICGLFGYDLSQYLCLKEIKSMREMERSLIEEEGTEVNEAGKHSISIYLLIGKGERYFEFLRSLNAVPNWRDYSEQNPIVNYTSPQSKNDVIFNILKKAYTPSTSETFSFLNPAALAKAVVYMLDQACVTTKERIKLIDSDEKYEVKKIKKSLLRALYDVNKEKGEIEQYMMDVLFPNSELYDSIISEVERSTSWTKVKTNLRRPQKLITMLIPKSKVISSLGIWEVVQRLWFEGQPGIRNKGSETEFKQSLTKYKALFPWISKDINESLKASPFKDHTSMADFFRSFVNKMKTVKILGQLRRNEPIMITIENVIKRCYCQGYYFVETNSKTRRLETLNNLSKLASNLNLMSQGPAIKGSNYSESGRSIVSEIVNKADVSLPNEQSVAMSILTNLSKKDATLAIIQTFIKKSEKKKAQKREQTKGKSQSGILEKLKSLISNNNNEAEEKELDLNSLIIASKRGVYGYWLQSQRPNKEIQEIRKLKEKNKITDKEFQKMMKETPKYLGPGLFSGAIDDKPLVITVNNDVITGIKVNRVILLKQNANELSRLIEDINIAEYKTEKLIMLSEDSRYVRGYFDLKLKNFTNVQNENTIKIYEMSEAHKISAPALNEEDWDWELNNFGLPRIIQRSGESKITVLSMESNLWRFNPKETLDLGLKSTMNRRWSDFSELEVEEFLNEFKSIKFEMDPRYKDTVMDHLFGMKDEKLYEDNLNENKKLLRWMKETLIQKAKQRYSVAERDIVESIEVEDEEEDKEIIAEYLKIKDSEDIATFGAEEEDEDPFKPSDYFIDSDEENETENVDNAKNDSNNNNSNKIGEVKSKSYEDLKFDNFFGGEQSLFEDMLKEDIFLDEAKETRRPIKLNRLETIPSLHPFWNKVLKALESLNERPADLILSNFFEKAKTSLGSEILSLVGNEFRQPRKQEDFLPTISDSEIVANLVKKRNEYEITGKLETKKGSSLPIIQEVADNDNSMIYEDSNIEDNDDDEAYSLAIYELLNMTSDD